MRSIKKELKERGTLYTWIDRLILYLYLGRANNEHLRVLQIRLLPRDSGESTVELPTLMTI